MYRDPPEGHQQPLVTAGVFLRSENQFLPPADGSCNFYTDVIKSEGLKKLSPRHHVKRGGGVSFPKPSADGSASGAWVGLRGNAHMELSHADMSAFIWKTHRQQRTFESL